MSKLFNSKSILLVASLALIITLLAGSLLVSPQASVKAASSVIVNGATTYQTIDGFGGSGAFELAKALHDSSQATTVLDWLFSPTTGAGLSALRNEIGSSTTACSAGADDGDNVCSIEPTSPGSPTGTPAYTDVTKRTDLDGYQFWLTQQAMTRGATQFYANAWSAPAYMKTIGTLYPGGFLCGAVGAPACTSGDWRQAYANYLVQYLKYYSAQGINYQLVGFLNEPDWSPSYTGMNMDSTTNTGGLSTLTASMPQTNDFIHNYLAPAIKTAGLTTKVACCDATNWPDAKIYSDGLMSGAAAADVAVVTGHGYDYGTGIETVPLASAMSAGKKTWQTEVYPMGGSFDTAWDDNTNGSGYYWANRIWAALTKGQVSGFLYWYLTGTSNDNGALVYLNGTTATASSRLWAFGNYSRFVRPGAVRIDATTGNTNLEVSAFKNTNGSFAIVVLNAAAADEPVTFDLSGGNFASVATPYLTNATNSLAQQTGIPVSGGFTATVPARSLVTYYILDGGPTPTPCSTCSPTPTKTMTRTVTPTATICLSCTLRVQYRAGVTVASTTQPEPQFEIVNTSTGSIPLSALTLRYWYTVDGTKTQTFNCDYSIIGCTNITGTFGTMSTPTSTADTYLQIGFTGSGVIAAGGNSGDIQTRINKSDWTAYTQTNDYSFDATKTAYTDWNNVTMYYNGTLVWGIEPGGVVGPTATFTLTPSISKTPTRTLTPAITLTPTRTPTIGVTNTPTRTSTVGITNTPTRTVTAGITLTPTRTPTVGITNTASPTLSISPTITPTIGGACSPVTSTITAPFTQDGVGTFCWQSTNLGAYINSWNLTSLTVNGVSELNVYVAVGSLPAKINGYWYISYNSTVSYGHFETK